MTTESCVCVVCGSSHLVERPGFAALARVTSDCRPFPAGGRLAACADCAMVQKLPTPLWHEETARIYREYAIYHQSGGREQAVLDAVTGRPRRRSQVIVDRLAAGVALPAAGRMIDIGCGNGAMISAFAERLPGWSLSGFEIDSTHDEVLRAIPGFARLYTGSLDAVPPGFDVITMLHALEHFAEPVAVLRDLHGKLAPGGLLLIQVPNAALNPFDLMIADHLSHFTPDSLAHLVGRAGFRVESVATDWVAKEISLQARPAAGPATGVPVRAGRPVSDDGIAWLETLVNDAGKAAQDQPFGLFGTSIAATWLFGALADRVAFFVDEDPGRAGGTYFDRPVLAPEAVPAGACVFLALAPTVADAIGRRLGHLPIRFFRPSAL